MENKFLGSNEIKNLSEFWGTAKAALRGHSYEWLQ